MIGRTYIALQQKSKEKFVQRLLPQYKAQTDLRMHIHIYVSAILICVLHMDPNVLAM